MIGVPGIVAEVIGWAGAGCLFPAYALLSAGRLPVRREPDQHGR